MAIIEIPMKELKDGEAHYISLVDRSASRMPFRVVKNEGEEMSIDLSGIKKPIVKAEPVQKSSVLAVVVQARKRDEENAAVAAAVKAQGFSVDNAIKDEADGTVCFMQPGVESLEGQSVIRLSDQAVVVVKGFQPQADGMKDADFGATASANGFYQGIDSSLDVLFQKICTELSSADDEVVAAQKIQTLCQGFTKYAVGLAKQLPTAAFKTDIAVRQAVTKLDPAQPQVGDLLTDVPYGITENDWGQLDNTDKIRWLQDSTSLRKGECMQCAKMKKDGATEAQMAEAHKNHSQKADAGVMDIASFIKSLDKAPEGFDRRQDEWSGMPVVDRLNWMSASYNEANKDGAQKSDLSDANNCETCSGSDGWASMSNPEKIKMHSKHDGVAKKETLQLIAKTDTKLDEVLKGLATLATTVSGLATKQDELQKKVDESAQKTDAVDKALKGTVAGSPVIEGNTPGLGRRAQLVKSEDPRVGTFDTALMSRTQKAELRAARNK